MKNSMLSALLILLFLCVTATAQEPPPDMQAAAEINRNYINPRLRELMMIYRAKQIPELEYYMLYVFTSFDSGEFTRWIMEPNAELSNGTSYRQVTWFLPLNGEMSTLENFIKDYYLVSKSESDTAWMQMSLKVKSDPAFPDTNNAWRQGFYYDDQFNYYNWYFDPHHLFPHSFDNSYFNPHIRAVRTF